MVERYAPCIGERVGVAGRGVTLGKGVGVCEGVKVAEGRGVAVGRGVGFTAAITLWCM